MKKNGIIEIPLINIKREVCGYTIVDFYMKDILLQYSYHIIRSVKHPNYICVGASDKERLHHKVIKYKEAKKFKSDMKYVVDHINNNPLDNRECNLQYATHGLNSQNRKKKNETYSKYVGVSFDVTKNKWCSYISHNYQRFYLGTFEDEVDAAKTYDVHHMFHYLNDMGVPKTNGILSEEEISDIIMNGIPEKYKLKEKVVRDLPKYIYLTLNNTYCISIKTKKYKFWRIVKTLELALETREEFFAEIAKKEKEEEDERNSREIIRNEQGQAIIQINDELECVVDDIAWHHLVQFQWKCINTYSGFTDYPSARIEGKIIYLHRYVYAKYKGEIPDDLTVDHIIPGNIFDARINNLRLATKQLQGHNRNKQADNFDIYRGVQFRGNTFRCLIEGTLREKYDTAEEAAARANEIFSEKYGENARLNDIDWSKRTTKYNRIPEEIINEEFIMNLRKVIDVANVAIIKRLDYNSKGPIRIGNIDPRNIEEYKTLIVNMLYYPDRVEKAKTLTEDMITMIKDLVSVAIIKKLHMKGGGTILVTNINSDNFLEYKEKIINILYCDKQSEIDKKADNITREYIMGIKTATDLIKIVRTKKLGLNMEEI